MQNLYKDISYLCWIVFCFIFQHLFTFKLRTQCSLDPRSFMFWALTGSCVRWLYKFPFSPNPSVIVRKGTWQRQRGSWCQGEEGRRQENCRLLQTYGRKNKNWNVIVRLCKFSLSDGMIQSWHLWGWLRGCEWNEGRLIVRPLCEHDG